MRTNNDLYMGSIFLLFLLGLVVGFIYNQNLKRTYLGLAKPISNKANEDD